MSSGILGGAEAYKAFLDAPRYDVEVRKNFNVWKYSVDTVEVAELACKPVGNPYGISLAGHCVHPNNFPNHYRATFLSNLLGTDQRGIILELGGGYGAPDFTALPSRYWVND